MLGHLSEIILMDTFISQSVLAFSTITTMLAQIKQVRTFRDNCQHSRPHKVVRALNALATLLVREKEAVAVVGNPTSAQFEVIACAMASVPNGPSQNEADGGSANPSKDMSDALTPLSDVPALIDPTKPKFDVPLEEYINNNPYVLFNNSMFAGFSKKI